MAEFKFSCEHCQRHLLVETEWIGKTTNCPDCGKTVNIFAEGAGERLAEKYGVKLLAKIPIDPVICQGGDAGTPFIQAFAKTVPGRIFAEMADKLFE